MFSDVLFACLDKVLLRVLGLGVLDALPVIDARILDLLHECHVNGLQLLDEVLPRHLPLDGLDRLFELRQLGGADLADDVDAKSVR